MEGGYNMRSPAVKRLLREAAELHIATEEYFCQPLDENLFEWHFTVRGPMDSDFEQGVYHGRIILPTEYPMKPPNIIFMTTNGRFEVGKKICLSISGHHPETWQPSWSIRTALLAIIGYMPSKGLGNIGSLDWSGAERRRQALRSEKFECPVCGPVSKLVAARTKQSAALSKESDNAATPDLKKEEAPPSAEESDVRISGAQIKESSPDVPPTAQSPSSCPVEAIDNPASTVNKDSSTAEAVSSTVSASISTETTVSSTTTTLPTSVSASVSVASSAVAPEQSSTVASEQSSEDVRQRVGSTRAPALARTPEVSATISPAAASSVLRRQSRDKIDMLLIGFLAALMCFVLRRILFVGVGSLPPIF